MKFIDVDPNSISNLRDSRRGRVSYPLLKSFLETNKYLVQLDTTGIQQSRQALTSSLTAYIRNHHLPIKMFQREGNIYLMRLDIDADGNQIADWAEKQINTHIEAKQKEVPLDAGLVSSMVGPESLKVTK